MIATTVEQSKKLAEFLPIESADMWYPGDVEDDIECGFGDVQQELYINYGDGHPCWSLAALLEVIPKNLDIGRPVLATNYRGYYWVSYFDEYMKETNLTSKIYDNPIDACYEMIVWLKENGKI